MVWVRLDDKFHSNEKVLEAGYAAAGIYAMALSYCGDHLTDGRVPQAWANQHPKVQRDKLVKAGLWKKAKGGYTIPDFNTLNPTKAAVLEQRAKQREGGLKGARKRWETPPPVGSTDGSTQTPTQAIPKRPVPLRPLGQKLLPAANVKGVVCPMPSCTVTYPTEERMLEHLDNVHALEGQAAQDALTKGAR